jgi:hypothetical protein
MTAEAEQSKSPEEGQGKPEKAQGEPSLGPACLVVTILSLAAFTAICGIASWFVFANQPELAKKAIEKTLVPWVEKSQLSPADKESIVNQLEGLVVRLENDEFSKQELTRLRNCLQDNPVLLWGEIQSIEYQAAGAGLTDTEVETLRRVNQRLLRMATERTLGRNDIEFTIQQLSEVSEQGDSLEVRSDLTAEQIRQYMQRAENLFVRSKVPNEPFEKTPAQAFEILIKAALNVPTAGKQ